MSPSEFSDSLKALGITQRWLAEQMGKNPHTVGKWARGEAPVPREAAFILELLGLLQLTDC
jgi:transcriptional regulator with XRE-family HTH domain